LLRARCNHLVGDRWRRRQRRGNLRRLHRLHRRGGLVAGGRRRSATLPSIRNRLRLGGRGGLRRWRLNALRGTSSSGRMSAAGGRRRCRRRGALAAGRSGLRRGRRDRLRRWRLSRLRGAINGRTRRAARRGRRRCRRRWRMGGGSLRRGCRRRRRSRPRRRCSRTLGLRRTCSSRRGMLRSCGGRRRRSRTSGWSGVRGRRGWRRRTLRRARAVSSALPRTLGRRAGRPTTRRFATVLARTRSLAALRTIFRLTLSGGGLRHQDGGGRPARIVGLCRIRDPLAEGQRGGRQHDETQLGHDRIALLKSDARRVPSREPCDEPIEVRLQCGSRDTSIRVLRFLFFVARCVDAATFMAHSRHQRMRMTNLTVKPSRSSHTN
jgi:hypothetical protein